MNQILVIDDDAAVRYAYELALEDEDAQLRLADCGAEGLRMARELRPDLVFLDLKMPGMDGVEVLRGLNALYPGLRVYVVTAFANEFMDQLRAAKREGLDFQVAAKPLSANQIQVITRVNLIAREQ